MYVIPTPIHSCHVQFLVDPYVTFSALFAILIALPLGKLLEWILPKYRISVIGYTFSLNPGPFNIKEQSLIAIMANIGVNGAFIADVATAMHTINGIKWSMGKIFLLGLPLQIIGFSFAGFLHQFLVWPASMIWPGVLVRCALINAIHSNYGKNDANHISRQLFFYLACLCSFVWYWVPGYLWTGLSVFNWVCWIAPNNVVVNSLFGSISGFGMGLFTFDWVAVSSYLGSPLVIPVSLLQVATPIIHNTHNRMSVLGSAQHTWRVHHNYLDHLSDYVGCVYFVSLLPDLYSYFILAKNVWYSQYMPVSVGIPFDNTGAQYNLSAVVNKNAFDQEKYEQYSPMFLPITYSVSYGAIFAIYPAALVHTFLWYRKDITHQFRRGLKDQKDIHSRLMSKYSEVPHWWFLTLGIVSLVMGIIGIEVCDTKLPVWAYFFSLIFSMAFALPFGIMQAVTNQVFAPSILAEMFFGYMLPGRPLATMILKITGGYTGLQAILYSSDQKFGHYMKIPPRLLFSAQVISTIISMISSIVAQLWAMDNIPDICSPHQKDAFTCPNTNIYNTASIIWGGIGPKRIFSPGAL